MTEENITPQTKSEITEEIIEEGIDQADDEENDAEWNEAEETKEESTLTFNRSHVYTALLPLAFVVGLAVGYIFWGRTTPETVAPAAADEAPAQAAQAQNQPVQRYDIPEDDDPVWGPDQAPITIVEFSDFECPYCRKWHTEVWPKIQEAYPDQVRLVYRDFPLTTIHANATPAAAAANCAGEQDTYWEYNELLFNMELGLSKSAYAQYARDLGLAMETFNECLDSGRQNEEIQGDYEYAVNLGVRSTPTFFVNGLPVVGAQPFEIFQQIIDSELAGETP